MLDYNKKLKCNARRLRNNMAKAEVLLWLKLKNKQLKGLQFYRQKPIGNYIEGILFEIETYITRNPPTPFFKGGFA